MGVSHSFFTTGKKLKPECDALAFFEVLGMTKTKSLELRRISLSLRAASRSATSRQTARLCLCSLCQLNKRPHLPFWTAGRLVVILSLVFPRLLYRNQSNRVVSKGNNCKCGIFDSRVEGVLCRELGGDNQIAYLYSDGIIRSFKGIIKLFPGLL